MIGALSRRCFLKAAGAGGALIAAPGLGHTAWSMQGSQRGALRLVFYTDIHARTAADTPAALAMAAEAINAQKPDLVVCGGDLIAGGFAATSDEVAPRWDAYADMEKAIEGEHHAVIGNHDLVGARRNDGQVPATDPRQDYKRRLGLSRTYGSFDALGYRFILLDSLRISNDVYEYHGWVSSEQREWIAEVLSRTPSDMPIVMVLHMPLLTAFFAATRGASFRAKPNRVVVNNTDVLALFAHHNLVLVLQGHLHVSEMLRWRGTTFLTGGAVCGNWWNGSYFGTVEGFNAMTLHHDRIEWDYIDYGWNARRPRR